MPLESQTEKLLFIAGHRKAGTSMAYGLFDGHPNTCCYPPDLTVLYAYYPHFLKNSNDTRDLILRLERIVIGELEAVYQTTQTPLPHPISDFKELFFEQLSTVDDLQDIQKIITQILLAFQQWSGNNISDKSLNIVKETSVEIYAKNLFHWFPQAKLLHIMRDPRDNYAALKAGVEKKYTLYGEDEHVTLFSLINRLGTSMRIGLSNTKQYKDSNKITKFEDLTTSPEQTMKDICNWLDLPFLETLLQPSKLGKPTSGNNFDGKKFSTISNSHVGAWKERITEEEAQVIEFYLGDLMEQYGYNLEFSQEQRAQAASKFYQWSNYKYFYFDRFENEEQ